MHKKESWATFDRKSQHHFFFVDATSVVTPLILILNVCVKAKTCLFVCLLFHPGEFKAVAAFIAASTRPPRPLMHRLSKMQSVKFGFECIRLLLQRPVLLNFFLNYSYQSRHQFFEQLKTCKFNSNYYVKP